MGYILRIGAALAAICLLSACNSRHLVFTTYTKVGLDVTTTDGNTPHGVFGYKRFEGAIIPYEPVCNDPNDVTTCNTQDAASVYAAIDVDNRWFGGISILQVFATGDAAVDVANDPNSVASLIIDVKK